MSSPRAAHQAARAFAGLADGLIVLVALASAIAAGLVVAGAIRGVAEVRVPSTEKAATAAPSARPSAAAVVPTPTATVFATPPPSVVPSPAISASPYAFGGHRYAGLDVGPGTTLRAPLEGTIEIRLYQYINGEVRVGSNVPSLPFYPYVTIVSSDRRLTFRPGALGTDIQLLVQDGQGISVGAPLFRASGAGRSSWATFYDPSVSFQVVASLQILPSGGDLDPLIGYLGD